MTDPSHAALRIDTEHRGSATVLSCTGDIDLTASPLLRQHIHQVQGEKIEKLVIDLGGVPYMDSSGVATLVEAMQLSRKSGASLVLCAMQDKVRSIFEIARLDTVFTIVPDVEQALES